MTISCATYKNVLYSKTYFACPRKYIWRIPCKAVSQTMEKDASAWHKRAPQIRLIDNVVWHTMMGGGPPNRPLHLCPLPPIRLFLSFSQSLISSRRSFWTIRRSMRQSGAAFMLCHVSTFRVDIIVCRKPSPPRWCRWSWCCFMMINACAGYRVSRVVRLFTLVISTKRAVIRWATSIRSE